MNSTMRLIVHRAQTTILMLIIFVGGFAVGTLMSTSEAQGRVAINDTDQAFEPFWEAYNIIQTRYIDPVSIETLVEGAIDGMMASLGDENSVYHNPEEYPQTLDIGGEYEGIGVQIRQIEETGEIEAVSVFSGSPAEAAGMRRGDVFLEVEGQSVAGLTTSELANLVRGPAGTPVNITIRRGEQIINLTIVRAKLEIPNVEYEMLADNIAYIRLFEFNALSRNQLNEAFRELDVNNTRGLIFDLRNNPGGLLSSAVDINSAFIRDGVILYEVFGDGTEEVFRANGNYANITVPIVVLVDEGSASASELTAGALQDTGVATIIGEVTFGKGTVQTVVPLSNNGGIRITVARYLTPNRNWVHKQGIMPDILVPWEGQPGDEDDPQLQAAIDFILGE